MKNRSENWQFHKPLDFITVLTLGSGGIPGGKVISGLVVVMVVVLLACSSWF